MNESEQKQFDELAVYTNEYSYVHSIPKKKEVEDFISSLIAKREREIKSELQKKWEYAVEKYRIAQKDAKTDYDFRDVYIYAAKIDTLVEVLYLFDKEAGFIQDKKQK